MNKLHSVFIPIFMFLMITLPIQSQQSGYDLVFISEDTHPSSDLYLFDPTTATVTRLTNVIGELFTRFVDSADCANDGRVFFTVRGQVHNVTPPETTINLLPLSTFRAYGISIHPTAPIVTTGKFNISVGNITDTVFNTLTSGDRIADMPDWSPDGSQIVYEFGDEDFNSGIAIINADGSNRQTICQSPAHNFAPDWSPDGQKIIFSSDDSGVYNIYQIYVDGSNRMQLTDQGSNTYPVWSPDGQWIAFTSTRDGYDDYPQIYVMRADGSDVRRITESDFDFRKNYMQCWLPLDNIIPLTATPITASQP